MASVESQSKVRFGPFDVTTQVFLKTRLSFALVNIKPILPGHVLVCPNLPHARLTDLSRDEVRDLFATVQRVQQVLARKYFPAQASSAPKTPAGSFNIAIQDGPDAGQTVPHMHVHILPRPAGTAQGMTPGTQGNAVYDAMTAEEANIGGALWDAELGRRPVAGGGYARVDELERKPRPTEEMVAEAQDYTRILKGIELGAE